MMQYNSKKISGIFYNKRVLFVTHKSEKYIRNSQEIKIIKKYCREIKVISADAKLKWVNYFSSVIKIFFNLIFLRTGRYDIIFLGYLPQFVIPILPFIKGEKTIVIDFFISLFDTMVFDKKIISQKHPLAGIAKWVDKITLKMADYIIADTKTHGSYFINELGADYRKIFVLYLEPDPDIYYPQYVKRPDALKKKYIVLYFGTILPLQGVGIILKAAQQLETNSDLLFIIIGPIKVKQTAKKRNHPNVLFIPWMGQNKLAEYIAMSDLCLAGHFNGETEKAKRVIPGKAFIYRAMNKPVILGENPANREMFSEQENDIYFVEMGDGKLLADKIMAIYRPSHK